MSVFNRAIIVIAAIIILAATVLILLVASGMVTPDTLPFAWLQSALQRVADATGGTLASIIAISAIVAVIMIGLLAIESMPPRKHPPLLISSSHEGTTLIDLDSICALAEHVGVAIHGVRDVKSSVEESPEGLLLDCHASLDLGSSVLEIEPDMRSRIKTAIEQLTGLPVAQIDIKVKYVSRRSKRLAVT